MTGAILVVEGTALVATGRRVDPPSHAAEHLDEYETGDAKQPRRLCPFGNQCTVRRGAFLQAHQGAEPAVPGIPAAVILLGGALRLNVRHDDDVGCVQPLPTSAPHANLQVVILGRPDAVLDP